MRITRVVDRVRRCGTTLLAPARRIEIACSGHSATPSVAFLVADFFYLLLCLGLDWNNATAILETRTRGRADDEATSRLAVMRSSRSSASRESSSDRKIAVAVFQTTQGGVLAVGITPQGAPHALCRCSSSCREGRRALPEGHSVVVAELPGVTQGGPALGTEDGRIRCQHCDPQLK